MEDEQKRRECRPKRCYQCCRVEEELWKSAYEELWPVVRTQLKRRTEESKESQTSYKLAKGA